MYSITVRFRFQLTCLMGYTHLEGVRAGVDGNHQGVVAVQRIIEGADIGVMPAIDELQRHYNLMTLGNIGQQPVETVVGKTLCL